MANKVGSQEYLRVEAGLSPDLLLQKILSKLGH
jgi:hypothetical protein